MAKITPAFLDQLVDGLGVRSYITYRKLRTDGVFQIRRCGTVYIKKPRPLPTPKEAQASQRARFCECDSYYINMTDGQRGMWFAYYFWSRKHGKTLSKRTRPRGCRRADAKRIHMSAYAYFQKKCLEWDLKDYLEGFLGAVIHPLRVLRTPEGWIVEAEITKAEWFELVEDQFIPMLTRLAIMRW